MKWPTKKPAHTIREVDYAEHGDYELVLLGERMDALRKDAEKQGFIMILACARKNYGGVENQAICFACVEPRTPELMRAFWTILLSVVHMSALREGTFHNVKKFQQMLARRLANSDGDSIQLK